jgi:predicted transcriptional regulator
MEAYNNLAENYDTVLSQLTGKSEELQSMQETRQQLEKEMKERLARMDRIVEREQQEADRARIRLAEIEHTHHQLLRSFRELNDRYIHLRERQARSTPEPASASTVQDSSGKTSKSRLKLNRG